MPRIIIPGQPEPEPEPGPEEYVITAEQLSDLVRDAIAANRAVRRTTAGQEALDRAVEVLYREGEVVLAASILQLAATRVAGYEHCALQRLMQLGIDLGHLGELDRHCRVCGCNDVFGCEGGCSWVEIDLCSACDGRLKAQSRRAAHRNSVYPGPGRDA